MKFITYKHNNICNWGIADTEECTIYPSTEIFDTTIPDNLLDFIKNHKNYINHLKEKSLYGSSLKFADVDFTSPITTPIRNILCVGKNYSDHIKEVNKLNQSSINADGFPAFFTKASSSINGPYSNVPLHNRITSEVDYEGELAVVIGSKGINISIDNAMDYVFGFSILNDVTARDLQRNHEQWFKGKSLDGFCPIGPWIVTKDEISDYKSLGISTFVNGDMRQKASFSNMMVNIPELISILSQGLTLYPGDIIATGTPSGVGMGFEPPVYLKKGDIVRIEVDGIGHIENMFV